MSSGKWFSLKPSTVVERGEDVADWGESILLSQYYVDANEKMHGVFCCLEVNKVDVINALSTGTSIVQIHSRWSDVYGCRCTNLRFSIGSAYFAVTVKKDLHLESMTVRESEDRFIDERLQLMERD
jgi:hypothetical protein